MAMPSHLSEFSGLFTTSFSINTTNLTLARFSELKKEALEKLLIVFETSLEGAIQARLFSNSIATYSLALAIFSAFVSYKSPKEKARKVATVVTFAAGLTATLAGFASLVYTFQIHDFNFWKNVCVKFIEHDPATK